MHQDCRRHDWVPGKLWDLMVTLDNATLGHWRYSMLFAEEEWTTSSFHAGLGCDSPVVRFIIHGDKLEALIWQTSLSPFCDMLCFNVIVP